MVGKSTKRQELDTLLAAANAQDMLAAAVTADDAPAAKPAPDIGAAALAKLARSADQVIMLGDPPYDAQATHQAGVKLIAVRGGATTAAHLADAAAILSEPADPRAHVAASPLASAAPWPEAPDAITGIGMLIARWPSHLRGVQCFLLPTRI
jgi:membrane protein